MKTTRRSFLQILGLAAPAAAVVAAVLPKGSTPARFTWSFDDPKPAWDHVLTEAELPRHDHGMTKAEFAHELQPGLNRLFAEEYNAASKVWPKT